MFTRKVFDRCFSVRACASYPRGIPQTTLEDFPPRQKFASFTIDQVLQKAEQNQKGWLAVVHRNAKEQATLLAGCLSSGNTHEF